MSDQLAASSRSHLQESGRGYPPCSPARIVDTLRLDLTSPIARSGIRLLRVPHRFALRLVLIALAPGILFAAQSTPSATPPLSSRVKTLNTIFSDAWED